MSIVRINEFQAKAGQGDALAQLLKSYDTTFRFLAGFQSHQVLQGVADADRVVVIETWDSIDAHKLAAQQIPVHAFEKVMGLLADSPRGAYYRQ